MNVNVFMVPYSMWLLLTWFASIIGGTRPPFQLLEGITFGGELERHLEGYLDSTSSPSYILATRKSGIL